MDRLEPRSYSQTTTLVQMERGKAVSMDTSAYSIQLWKESKWKGFVTELLRMLERRKRKMVLACTKCDAVDEIKIRYGANLSMYALKKKQVPFIEVSARESIEVFFSLVSPPKKHHLPKGVKRTSPSNYLTYRAVKETQKYDLNHARDAYRKLLQQKVTDFSATWSKVYPVLEREPEFSLVLQIAGKEGKEMVKKMFCLRLIEIKLTEASKQYGFSSARKKLYKDQSRSHQEYLSKAFKEHPDLGKWHTHLSNLTTLFLEV